MHRGAIVRIALKAFMTYDDLEVRPGAHLNMIIGPNGTGKSTLVAAIVLGLGGAPSVLGRSSQLAHYVKDGYNEASVLVELCGGACDSADQANCVVQRQFNTEGRCTWRLNGASSTLKRVLEAVTAFNIHVDNLCQVLPQEKVQDFSRMEPSQLLENTERAAGYTGIVDDHGALKKAAAELTEIQASISEVEGTLSGHDQQLSSLQLAADSQRQRQTFRRQIQHLRQQLAWLTVEESQRQTALAQQEQTTAQQQLNRAEQQLRPLKRRVDDCDARLGEYRRTVTSGERRHKQTMERLGGVRSQLAQYGEKISDLEAQLQAVISNEQERQTRATQLRDKLEFERQQLDEVLAGLSGNDEQQHQQQLRLLEDRISKLSDQLLGCQEARDSQHRRRQQLTAQTSSVRVQLKMLRDVDSRRLQLLRQTNAPTYNAVLWLRENQHRFSATVHEPVILLLAIERPALAKYVQAAIAWRDMLAFTCENRADMNLFIELVRERQQLRVSCVLSEVRNSTDIQQQAFIPALSRQQLTALGFHCTVSEMFACPAAVRHYLLDTYQLHNVPVADIAEAAAGGVLQALTSSGTTLASFMIADTHYRVRRSRYSHTSSTVAEQLRSADALLTTVVDEKRVAELQKEIDEVERQAGDVDADIQRLSEQEQRDTAELDNVRRQKRQLTAAQDDVRRLQLKVRATQRSLAECDAAAVDVECRRRVSEETRLRYVRQMVAASVEYSVVCERALSPTVTALCAGRQVQLTCGERRVAFAALQQRTDGMRRLRDAVQQASAEHQRRQQTWQKQRSDVLAQLGVCDDRSAWRALGWQRDSKRPSVDNVEASLREKQARVELLCGSGGDDDERTALRQYEQLRQQREQLETRRTQLYGQRDELRQRTMPLGLRWYGELQRVTAAVSHAFSGYFTRLGCAGEVALSCGGENDALPSSDDCQDVDALLAVVARLGVSVRVQYRAGERLSALSAQQHSGGERSVATMVYLISLQAVQMQLNKSGGGVPFRCVDEINQGMDEHNERRMFDFVVGTMCANQQYFLVTPKLLPNLSYPRNMTVLSVFNSPTSFSHRNFSVSQFCRGLQTRADRPTNGQASESHA